MAEPDLREMYSEIGALLGAIAQAFSITEAEVITGVEQNRLVAGSRLAIEIIGDELKIKPQRARKSLADLLLATPAGLCRAEGWDELAPVGAEL